MGRIRQHPLKRLTFIDSTKAHGSPPQLLASGQPREALTPGSRVEPASGREQPAQAVALVPSALPSRRRIERRRWSHGWPRSGGAAGSKDRGRQSALPRRRKLQLQARSQAGRGSLVSNGPRSLTCLRLFSRDKSWQQRRFLAPPQRPKRGDGSARTRSINDDTPSQYDIRKGPFLRGPFHLRMCCDDLYGTILPPLHFMKCGRYPLFNSTPVTDSQRRRPHRTSASRSIGGSGAAN